MVSSLHHNTQNWHAQPVYKLIVRDKTKKWMVGKYDTTTRANKKTAHNQHPQLNPSTSFKQSSSK